MKNTQGKEHPQGVFVQISMDKIKVNAKTTTRIEKNITALLLERFTISRETSDHYGNISYGGGIYLRIKQQ